MPMTPTQPPYPAHPAVGATPVRLVSNGTVVIHHRAGDVAGCAATRPEYGTVSVCLCRWMLVEWQ